MALLIFRLAHSFSHLHAPFKLARAYEEKRDSLSIGAFQLKRRCTRLYAEFSANAEKVAQVKAKTIVTQGNSGWHSACTRSSLALEKNEYDVKDRERFKWTEDDYKADWPNAAGAYRRIESANKGRRGERHARPERSQSSRFG